MKKAEELFNLLFDFLLTAILARWKLFVVTLLFVYWFVSLRILGVIGPAVLFR